MISVRDFDGALSAPPHRIWFAGRINFGMTMLEIKMTGFEELERSLKEAAVAIEQIQGEIATLKIDPNDPNAEGKATREIEAAVDRKVAPFRGNDLVAAFADRSKAAFAEEIRKRIEDARAQG